MSFFTRFSLKNVAAVLILMLLVTGGGIYTATELKMESMPDINFPVIVAITPFPGASPNDIDEKVTQPIVKALQGLNGVDKINSISADGTSVVVVQFNFDADLDKAQQEMKDRISQVKLPENALQTSYNRFGFNTFPIMNLAVTSDKKSPAELERWVNDVAKPALESVDGVGQVQIKGEGPKAVYIRLIPEKLKKYNLSVQQVQQALQGGQMSLPVGDLNQNDLDIPVRVEHKIRSIEDLKNYEIPLQPNMLEGMQEAFDQIGKGFQGLGQAVGGLGQAIGGLGQGMGQLGQNVGLLQAQVQILQQAQQLQAQIIGDQIALNQAMSENPKDPNKIEFLKQKIAAEEQGLRQLNEQLKKLQIKMPKGSGRGGAGLKMPRATSFGNKPKANNEVKIKTVKLSEIASITESAEDNTMITRTNGKPSVNIEIVKDPDANIVEVANQLKEKIDLLRKQNPEIEITMLFDQSRGVKASIESMVREGLLGALFAAAVILLFLRNFRMTLISIVSIPVSVFATLILLHQADITLNVMTLGGLAVAIGRVVDDSIVVIENIYRHLMKRREWNVNIILEATKEVASAITSSTLTTVSVFIPLGLVSGIVGKVFMPFAITVAVALLSSLIVAVTIVPVMAKLLVLRGKKVADHSESRSGNLYRNWLAWALDHKGMVITLSTLMLIASLSLVPLVGTSFLPSEKDKVMQINVKLPSGTELAKTNEIAREIEEKLKTYKEVKIISTSVGNLRGQLNHNGSIGSTNQASLFVTLDKNTNMDLFLADVRKNLEPFKKEGEIEVNEVKSVGPPSSQIQVSVKGDDIEKIRRVADELTEKMKKVKGLTNVTNNLSALKDQVSVEVDENKAAKQGLSAMQVAFTLRGMLEADTIMELEKGTQTQEVKLGLEKEKASSVEELRNIDILTPTGKMVKLGEIAAVKDVKGPITVQRENGEEYATVSGDIIVKDTGALTAEVQKIISSLKLPSGVTVSIGGDSQEMEKSFKQLGIAMIVAVAAVYLVMIITFGQATAPFAILFSLPYAVIGGLVGLYVSGQPISVSAMIGALMLIGIVVTNAIVLVDRVQQQRAKGLTVREALLEAAGTRLRPILMTALATVFALLPLGLGYGEGTLISQGLAVVVIGGLSSSTLLTLFIVPIMYEWFTKLQAKFSRNDEAENLLTG